MNNPVNKNSWLGRYFDKREAKHFQKLWIKYLRQRFKNEVTDKSFDLSALRKDLNTIIPLENFKKLEPKNERLYKLAAVLDDFEFASKQGLATTSDTQPMPTGEFLERFHQSSNREEKRTFLHDFLKDMLAGNPATNISIITTLQPVVDRFSMFSIENITNETNNENFRDWLNMNVTPLLKKIDAESRLLKQLVAESLPMKAHMEAFETYLSGEAQLEDLVGENQGEMVDLYKALHDAFEHHGLIEIEKLAAIPKDVHRINQIETIIDLYNLKISRTENDTKLDEKSRERKIQALQHLMERDIEALGGSV